MSSILKVDEIQDTSGNNIINESSDTITIGASGDTTNIVGTLQNNGSAITGDYVLLSSTDASSSSGVSLDLFSSTYKNYKIFLSNISGSANDWVMVRFRRSSADVSSSNYYNANLQVYKTSSAQGTYNNSNWGDSAIRMFVMGQASGRVGSSELTIFDPFGTTYTQMTSYSTYWENSTSYRTSIQGATLQDATTSVTGITVYPASGNFTGNIKLYGIK
jgi:hypothetical protein